jgi:hypothetical protein
MGYNFRAIDLSGLKPAVAVDQPFPVLQWAEIADLIIDDRYQRPLGNRNRSAIQAIANAFDWMQFSPVLLAPADGGKFAIIDGQHRVHAAALCGITRVPAQIVMASAAQQAKAFAGVNGTVVAITPHNVYRAALLANEPWAIRCKEVVDGAGCALSEAKPTSSARRPRVLYQIGTIRRMCGPLGQAEALAKVLSAIVSYDSNGRIPLYSDYLIRPCVEAIHGYDDLMQMDLAAFFAHKDPFLILDQADRGRREQGKSMSNRHAMRNAMNIYGVGK